MTVWCAITYITNPSIPPTLTWQTGMNFVFRWLFQEEFRNPAGLHSFRTDSDDYNSLEMGIYGLLNICGAMKIYKLRLTQQNWKMKIVVRLQHLFCWRLTVHLVWDFCGLLAACISFHQCEVSFWKVATISRRDISARIPLRWGGSV